MQGADEIAAHPVHQRLRFRVSQTRVELKHARPVGGHHESRVKEAGKRRSFRPHPFDHRIDHRSKDRLALFSHENTAVAVSAHATGVRSLIAVEHGFVILRCFERNHAIAIAEHDETDLFALKKLFDHQRAAIGHELLDPSLRFLAVLRDDDAFARGEPVRLQHDGIAEIAEFLDRPLRRIDGGKPRRGNAPTLHELFREGLAAFELCGGLSRSENG